MLTSPAQRGMGLLPEARLKRFRIDFSIRETDCPPEEAQGIRFGDEVDAKDLFDFFNRCRDAALTLFNGGKRPKSEYDELKAEAEKAKKIAIATQRAVMGAAQKPVEVDDIDHFKRLWGSSSGKGL